MNDSVSKRYAVALLSLAREENLIKEYIDEINQIIEVFNNNPGLEDILANYGLKDAEKKETIDVCFKNKIFTNILNLLYIIIDNKRGNLTKVILEEFIKEAYIDLNIKKGYIYTTTTLDKEMLTKMEIKVSKLINSKVNLENIIDKKLIGGFKVVVDDYVIDESITNKLNKIKESLKGEL